MPSSSTRVSGTRTVFRATGASTGGDHAEVRGDLPAQLGRAAGRHFHPSQAEHFTVVRGAFATLVDGVERGV